MSIAEQSVPSPSAQSESDGKNASEMELDRLHSVIDGSQTAMMMCDRDLVITYVNPATMALIRTHIAEFRKLFPDLDPNKLVGACIDMFHKKPDHQRRILGDPRNLPHKADVHLGSVIFEFRVTAIRDRKGNHLGANLEWADVTEDRLAARRAASLFAMVEGANNYYMMCDRDLVITYCNPAVIRMLSKYAETIRTVYPGFDTGKLVGRCIDDFHKNPDKQRRLLPDLSRQPYATEIKLGPLEFGLNLTALVDEKGNYVGNAVEWTDNNARAVYRNTVAHLIHSYKDGQLSARGDLSKLDEAYRPMLQGIHEVVESIFEPIQEAAKVLERIANRDLTPRVKGDYKGDHAAIKDALNRAIENLDVGLTQVNEAANQVATASSQISSGSQNLAQGSSEQASTLEEVSSNLQEVASMTKQNVANAQEARSLSDAAKAATQQGVQSMSNLSEAINKIKTSSDQTSKIVKTIDEIAFQTNLLALNAAVEAARAGDAGRGFAVVAEEVRNLAMRSAEAAKNTSSLIEESVNNAEGGVSLNAEVLKALENINSQVQKVVEVMNEIAAASQQQSEGIDQINTAIEQMNEVTQQTAANAEESAATAEELSGQAEEMLSLVSRFELSRANGHPARRANGPATAKASGLARARPPAGRPQPVAPNRRETRDPKSLIPFDDAEDADLLGKF